jgi:hypothetical protein
MLKSMHAVWFVWAWGGGGLSAAGAPRLLLGPFQALISECMFGGLICELSRLLKHSHGALAGRLGPVDLTGVGACPM